MSALIVVPQIIIVLLAPWTGRRAESWGRRPLLLIGIGVLPIRALLFTLITDPVFLIAVQMLDGISGAVLGILTALVVADLTRGTGRFTLAQGLVGTIAGIGAALSTTLTGLVAGSLAARRDSYSSQRSLSCPKRNHRGNNLAATKTIIEGIRNERDSRSSSNYCAPRPLGVVPPCARFFLR